MATGTGILPNLPPFKKGHPFAGADVAGTWVKSPGTLKQLADSFDTGDLGFTDPDEPIRAIPDPWAQPRTFAEALIVPQHSLEADIVPQWRGLLALIGLRGLCSSDYSLSLESFRFGDKLVFDKLLAQLAPRFAISDETALWLQPTVIRLNRGRTTGPCVAMLNPACLVSAARLSQHVRSESLTAVPWMRRDITDPTRLPDDQKLPKPMMAGLRAYLEGLADRLRGAAPNDARDAILGRLEDYIADVNREIVGRAPNASYIADDHEALPSFIADTWGRAELRESDDPAAASEGLLKLRDLALGGLKGIILVDGALATQEGRQGHSVTIWRHRTLSELLASEDLYNEVKAEAARFGYLMIKSEDLFTERAAQLSDAKIAWHPRGLQDALLPARPLALLLDGDLAGRFSVQHGGDNCSVRMRVDRIVDERTTAPVDLRRDYRLNPEKGAPELLPSRIVQFAEATIWPDFRHPKWRHYYARLAYERHDNAALPARALSAEIIAAALRDEGPSNLAKLVARLEAINGGAIEGGDDDWLRDFTSSFPQSKQVERVEFSDLGFEAVFYEAARQGGDRMVGCATLSLKPVNPDGARGIVAVDFGTTSTVACFNDGEPITLQARLVHPIDIEGSQQLRELRNARWKLQQFLPALGQQMPIPSVALLRQGIDIASTKPATRHVDFFNYEDALGRSEARATAEEKSNAASSKLASYSALLSNMRFNLKWGHQTAEIRASTDYLSQLLMMIAAEAAAAGYDPATLDWRFSIPDSLGEDLQKRFKSNIEPMIRELSSASEDEAVEPVPLAPFMPEGFAAARYMLSGGRGAGVRQGSINIVLDIGGGTTDISIWSDNKERWKGSFADMAGKLFFTSALINDPVLMRKIGLSDFADIIELAEKDKAGAVQEKRIDFAELLFNGPKLDEELSKTYVWNEIVSAEPGQALRATAYTFLGGLAYYLGLVARQLVASGTISEKSLLTPAFALCGRGSGFFRQAFGREGANSTVAHVLGAFSHAAGVGDKAKPPRVIISPAAKLEVVRGMVVKGSNMEPGQHESEILPAGVEIRFGSKEVLAADADIHAAKARGDAMVSDPVLLSDMLRFLDQSCKIKVDPSPEATAAGEPADPLEDDAYGAITEAIKDRVDAQRRPKSDLQIEPPFISGLRALILEMTAPEKGRSGRINITMGAG